MSVFLGRCPVLFQPHLKTHGMSSESPEATGNFFRTSKCCYRCLNSQHLAPFFRPHGHITPGALCNAVSHLRISDGSNSEQ